jgi:hypothetical protein
MGGTSLQSPPKGVVVRCGNSPRPSLEAPGVPPISWYTPSPVGFHFTFDCHERHLSLSAL